MVLLVLGSLTNVVGYQQVQSTAVNDSPLFRTRTQKATNEQQNILTSHYLGKGKDTLLQFPIKDNTNVLLKNIFESIKKMDGATFQRFLVLLKQRLKETTSLNEMQLLEINNGFTKIRKQADIRLLSPSQEPPTIWGCFTIDRVECLKQLIGLAIIIVGIIILFIIFLPLNIIIEIISKIFHWDYTTILYCDFTPS
ncbi:MAG: hypothetical protein IMZ43_03985 [Thermoplasmata archaeon]|nr:hypothetical protein [Thermoplasmata archaeon]MBE3136540.1 hypothetical protein [Thermoplasmata archaeon]